MDRKRVCYSCGTEYPDSIRFCPKDSADLEYAPLTLDDISNGTGRHMNRIGKILIRGVLAILLIASGFVLNSVVRSLVPDTFERGDLTVRTTPSGARVYLDGSQVGVSPVRLADIPTGVHEVRAVFPGYLDGQASVEILPSANQKVDWDLSPLPSYRQGIDKKKFIARSTPAAYGDTVLIAQMR